jgi:tetraprenyl-beta-curcumene synthase
VWTLSLPSWARGLLGVVAALRALAVFAAVVVPRVRSQLRGWERRADAIPDPVLRAQALASLRLKVANVEAAAVMSLLAPRRRRARVIALLVALQVLTDYLDGVSEAAVRDPLRNGLCLHEALVDAVRSDSRPTDYYHHHPRHDDGGYVATLVAFCQHGMNALPAAEVVRPTVVAAARRCGIGQSYTHDALHRGPEQLERWAARLAAGTCLLWWEAAAAASSSVAILALVGIAADPRTTLSEAQRVDAAYCFGIGALAVLLDNLVDRVLDAAVDDHNYLSYYDSAETAARRLATIAEEALVMLRRLDRHRRHEAVLAGVLAFYLSAPGAGAPYARPIKRELLAHASPAVWPILLALRLRRAIGG